MITTPKLGDLVLTPDRKQAMVEKVEGKLVTVVWHETALHWIRHSKKFRIKELTEVHVPA